jgi:hypothetical protein
MFSRIRRGLTFANVAMTLALVFAMSGGAFAASKYLITSTKQIKPSVLKQLKGKTGPTGKEGPKGANGTNGTNGEKGAPGTNGNPGANGKSVVAGVELGGTNCAEGGSNFEVEGSATKYYACNGKEGSPWTASGILPSGKTEKGAWGVISSGFALASITFTIPLSAAPTPNYVTVTEWNGGTPPTACRGTAEEPTATAGNLCVYETSTAGTSGTPTISSAADGGSVVGHAGKTGALITVIGSPAEAYGTWAVTG